VLVFLHHGLGCTALWRQFPERVAEATGLPALVYDRLGHGNSSSSVTVRTTSYLSEQAEVLRQLLALEKIQDFVPIGHSDGGTIALLHSALPDVRQPSGVITLAAHLFVEDVTRAGIRQTVDSFRNGMSDRLRKYHGRNTDKLFWDWAGTWLSPSFDSWNISDQMRKVRCPVLAIQGLQDEYGTLAQIEAIQANCDGEVETCLIPNCAHEPHVQASEAAIAAIRVALASWK
jgi:pimeloyl-ACP methyl ester carboxylesterase